MRPTLVAALAAGALLAIGTAAGAQSAKPPPAPPPLGLTLDAAYAGANAGPALTDIDRVLYRTRYLTLIDGFGMGSLRQIGDVIVLLTDGTAFQHDWAFPVTDLDIARSRGREPGNWFTWSQTPAGLQLVRSGGAAAGEMIDASDADLLVPMPVLTPITVRYINLDAASAGRPDDSSWIFMGVRAQHVSGSLSFLAPDEVIITAVAPHAVSSAYRFDGYALILSTPNGEERHFFAAFAGATADGPPGAVVIDGDAYFVE